MCFDLGPSMIGKPSQVRGGIPTSFKVTKDKLGYWDKREEKWQ